MAEEEFSATLVTKFKERCKAVAVEVEIVVGQVADLRSDLTGVLARCLRLVRETFVPKPNHYPKGRRLSSFLPSRLGSLTEPSLVRSFQVSLSLVKA
ncbi:hypothetical protein Pint_27570 [Pistacia integerrima]|uniref:Uncharacterized protein n=1 Tax=Pistacia integerrima TaxID=434235 RepID=A0ACC0YQE0_9ROSI|nr:hypothetical protein Pint_27570 [Pistacia integerrima]